MTAGAGHDVTDSAFVGREHEMGVLRAALVEAGAGRGRLILLSGEPGIGKTRTAEELASCANDGGAQVVWGRCFEGEGAPAFWPWVQVIRAVIKYLDADGLRAAIGSAGPIIAQIVPQIRERLPDLPLAAGVDSADVRFHLFDSIVKFLGQLSRRAPLVVIFDDLQGADEPSLRLLQFVVRELRDMPVLLLGTFRDVALRPEHPLTATLAEVLRESRTQRLVLTGLSVAEVARFIEETAGVLPDAGVMAAVHGRTGGNPLFVTELVRVLFAEGLLDRSANVIRAPMRIPAGVRAVIHRRLAPLSVECNAVLSAASAIGRELRFDVLDAMAGIPWLVLLNALQEAVSARVLMDVPGPNLGYRFTHALIRETLYDELGAARCIALHRQVGEAIERLPGADECLAELAYHFFEAGRASSITPDPDGLELGQWEGANYKAVSYAQRAGDRALALLAYEESVRLYDAGLHALDRRRGDTSASPSDEQRRYELLMARGRAQRATDVAGAKRTFKLAVEAARKLGAPEALGWAVLGIADWLPLEATDGGLVTLLEEAIAAVGAADSPLRASALHARLLGRLATELCLSDTRGRRATLARQAVGIARQLGDAATLAHALFAQHVADCGPENAAERLAVATEMVEAAEAAGSGELSLHGRVCRIVNFLELGDGPALDTEIEVFTQLAEALRQPRYLAWSAHFRAVRAISQGRFDEGERLAFEMMAQAQRGQELAADSLFGGEMFALRDLQGRLDEFEGAMKALAVQLESQGNSVGVRCGLAGLYSELGRAAEAKTEFEPFAADEFASLPHDGFWLNQIACLVRACAFLGDVPRAAALYDLLQPYDGRAVALGHPGTFYDGAVAHSLGMLAATLSRWETASQHFEDSLKMSRGMGARPHVARTQYEYAAMLFTAAARDSGVAGESIAWVPDEVKTRALLTDALATAQELGMKRLTEKAQTLEDSIQQSAISGQQTVAAASPLSLRLGTGLFRKEGDYWTVAYGGHALRLTDSKGVQYLAQLLHHPRREFLALDLVGATVRPSEDPTPDCSRARFTDATDDMGPLLDARAKAAYKRRLGDLRDELAEAEQHNDVGRAARAREEMDLISQQLAAAMGLHGTNRRGSSQAERARQTVTKGIKSAIAKIRSSNPALARYLATTVATGYFCAYLPDPDVMISWLV